MVVRTRRPRCTTVSARMNARILSAFGLLALYVYVVEALI